MGSRSPYSASSGVSASPSGSAASDSVVSATTVAAFFLDGAEAGVIDLPTILVRSNDFTQEGDGVARVVAKRLAHGFFFAGNGLAKARNPIF